MRIVGIFEAKTKLSELIEAGENDSKALDILADVRASLRARNINFTIEEIIEWKNEGRR
jgi:hypothetical protein